MNLYTVYATALRLTVSLRDSDSVQLRAFCDDYDH